MSTTPQTTSPRRPVVVVRLSNWIGDVVLMLPALVRLSRMADLRLVGRRWAPDLLAAYGWPCHVYPAKLKERVRLLRSLKQPGVPAHGLCVPTSFSSALEFRLAGLPAIGYAREGRSPLLKQALPLDHTIHMRAHYDRLFRAMEARLGHPDTPPQPDDARLCLMPEAHAQARKALHDAGIGTPFVVVCPISSGGLAHTERTWPHFPALARQLAARHIPVVTCPGPGEEAAVRSWSDDAICLPNLPVSVYAAVMAAAGCVVSIDTGAGHIAASLGTPTISVLGVTLPERWGIQGPDVQIVRHWPEWPAAEAILGLMPTDTLTAQHKISSFNAKGTS